MKKNYLIVLLLIISLGGTLFYFISNKGSTNVITSKIQQDLKNKKQKLYQPNNCDIKKEQFEVSDFAMEPTIKVLQKVTLFMNYYNCNKNIPKIGDIVVFENPFTLNKLVRKIVASPGDSIVINKKDKTINVNGKILKNSDGKKYVLGDNELKWFTIYMDKDSKIIKGVYFLFSDSIQFREDSRTFGPISIEGIIGKVEK